MSWDDRFQKQVVRRWLAPLQRKHPRLALILSLAMDVTIIGLLVYAIKTTTCVSCAEGFDLYCQPAMEELWNGTD